MPRDLETERKAQLLNNLAMVYETAVILLPAEGYLEEFLEVFEIKNRDLKLIPAPDGFAESLREVSGDDVWRPIAEKTERLFGLPKRVTVFEDSRTLREELEGTDGLGPFFFIFDLMFCEYEDFCLCFISGSNN